MTKTIITSLALLFTTSALANNPGVFCVASTKYRIVILPKQKKVITKAWGNTVDEFRILKTEKRYLEVYPAIWQTTYTLEDGFQVVTNFPTNTTSKATGYATRNGTVAAEYYYCSSSN